MAMCAGVQKVSRPIDMCQEMSHSPPIFAETMAAIELQMYQGIAFVAVAGAHSPCAGSPIRTGGFVNEPSLIA